jgi:hypothetical protein
MEPTASPEAPPSKVSATTLRGVSKASMSWPAQICSRADAVGTGAVLVGGGAGLEVVGRGGTVDAGGGDTDGAGGVGVVCEGATVVGEGEGEGDGGG